MCQKINRAVAGFRSWCESNRLIINFDKTVLLKFRSKSHKCSPLHHTSLNFNINFVDKVSHLGTVLDCDLTWRDHIDRVSAKLNSAFFAISSLKPKFKTDTLLTAYYGLFHPHLSYTILVWGLSPHAHRLFILQKRVIRLIYGIKFRDTCANAFKSYNILTLTCIYLYKMLTFVHSNKIKFEMRTNIHEHDTRHGDHLCLDRHKHSYFQKSPFYSGVKLFNMLPREFRLLELYRFKSKLRLFLGRHAFYSVSEFVEGMGKFSSELRP